MDHFLDAANVGKGRQTTRRLRHILLTQRKPKETRNERETNAIRVRWKRTIRPRQRDTWRTL